MSSVDGHLTGVVFWSHMQITKRHWVAAGVGFVVAVFAYLGWANWPKASVTPIRLESTFNAASTTGGVTPTGQTATTSVAIKPFPINPADTIASWSFKGADAGNDTLMAQANADIASLAELFGKGKYDDYDLYNGIANDYVLMGNGEAAYRDYNHSIAIHPNKGLAYVNLGHLMDELGALHTARDAYAKAVALEPTVESYWLSYLNFLATYEPKVGTTAPIFTAAKKATNSAPDVLIAEANWLGNIGRFADAIADWKTVRSSVGTAQQAAIDTKIAHLQAQI